MKNDSSSLVAVLLAIAVAVVFIPCFAAFVVLGVFGDSVMMMPNYFIGSSPCIEFTLLVVDCAWITTICLGNIGIVCTLGIPFVGIALVLRSLR